MKDTNLSSLTRTAGRNSIARASSGRSTGSTRPIAALMTLAVAGSLVTAMLPGEASAASYNVYSCSGPDGTPLGTVGWLGSTSIGPPPAPQTARATATDTCSSGGALAASLSPSPYFGDAARWRFTAPAGSHIVSLALQRSTGGLRTAPNSSRLNYSLVVDGAQVEGCEQGPSGGCGDYSGEITRDGLTAQSVTASVSCANPGTGSCDSSGVGVSITRARFSIADDDLPTTSALRVLNDGASGDAIAVRFNASDAGGGLRSAQLLVNGLPAASKDIGGSGCVPLRGDDRGYATIRPCAESATDVDLSADLSLLPRGSYSAQLRLVDAAGNTSTTPIGECSDGLDNNGNGLSDGADPGCFTGLAGRLNPTANEAPAALDRLSGSMQIAQCAKRPITLTQVQRSGRRKVKVAGVTAPRLIGQRVSLGYRVGRRVKAIGTVVVNELGAFSLTATGRKASPNSAKYIVFHGSDQSVAATPGLAIRVSTAYRTKDPTKAYIAGVVRPAKRLKTTVRLQIQTACGRWRTIARPKIIRGRWTRQFTVPSGPSALVLRAQTMPRASRGRPTTSLPFPIAIR
jgi:hypothetical protein